MGSSVGWSVLLICQGCGVPSLVRAYTRNNQWVHQQVEQQIYVSLSLSPFLRPSFPPFLPLSPFLSLSKKIYKLKKMSSYQLPPSGSEGSAPYNCFQSQSSTQKWGKSRGSAVPPLPRSGVPGSLLCSQRPRSRGRKKVRRKAEVSAHSPAVEDMKREGPYLTKSGLFSALLPALPQVPGVLTRAPVAT